MRRNKQLKNLVFSQAMFYNTSEKILNNGNIKIEIKTFAEKKERFFLDRTFPIFCFNIEYFR